MLEIEILLRIFVNILWHMFPLCMQWHYICQYMHLQNSMSSENIYGNDDEDPYCVPPSQAVWPMEAAEYFEDFKTQDAICSIYAMGYIS